MVRKYSLRSIGLAAVLSLYSCERTPEYQTPQSSVACEFYSPESGSRGSFPDDIVSFPSVYSTFPIKGVKNVLVDGDSLQSWEQPFSDVITIPYKKGKLYPILMSRPLTDTTWTEGAHSIEAIVLDYVGKEYRITTHFMVEHK